MSTIDQSAIRGSGATLDFMAGIRRVSHYSHGFGPQPCRKGFEDSPCRRGLDRCPAPVRVVDVLGVSQEDRAMLALDA
jgi:hypothetical protein